MTITNTNSAYVSNPVLAGGWTIFPNAVPSEQTAARGPDSALMERYAELCRQQETAWAEAERQHRAAWEAEARRVAHAEQRAEALLLSLLSPQQKAEYQNKAQRWFHVQGSAGGLYRLHSCHQLNILQLDPQSRRTLARLCVVLPDRAPIADLLIAELLLLRSNEKGLRRIARIRREAA